jgi:hypothetical protein
VDHQLRDPFVTLALVKVWINVVEVEVQVGGASPEVAPPGVEHAGLQGVVIREKGQHVAEEVVGEEAERIIADVSSHLLAAGCWKPGRCAR